MCTLLVDTGADISILKANIVNPSELVNVDENCSVSGITQQKLQTLGTITTDIICPNNTSIQH